METDHLDYLAENLSWLDLFFFSAVLMLYGAIYTDPFPTKNSGSEIMTVEAPLPPPGASLPNWQVVIYVSVASSCLATRFLLLPDIA